MSELKTYGSYLKESILDPVRDNLCNDIWRKEDKLLKPFVKEKILSIFYEWMKNLKIDKKPDAIKLVGSMAGYQYNDCLLYTSPSPRDRTRSRMPSSA